MVMNKKQVAESYLLGSSVADYGSAIPVPLPDRPIDVPVDRPKYKVRKHAYGEFCKIQSRTRGTREIRVGAIYSTSQLRDLELQESPDGGGPEKTYIVDGIKIRAKLDRFDPEGDKWRIIEISEKKDRKTLLDELKDELYNITGKYLSRNLITLE
ncbi:hypothetical protein E2P64_00755 [Candidatus Bathyarchaeota archaeon]|nr:hypothetical protein E2P64_00755 [Candidatus Bathyarchaeota archaeon]